MLLFPLRCRKSRSLVKTNTISLEFTWCGDPCEKVAKPLQGEQQFGFETCHSKNVRPKCATDRSVAPPVRALLKCTLRFSTAEMSLFAWATTFEVKILKFHCFLKQKRCIGTRNLKTCHWSFVISMVLQNHP